MIRRERRLAKSHVQQQQRRRQRRKITSSVAVLLVMTPLLTVTVSTMHMQTAYASTDLGINWNNVNTVVSDPLDVNGAGPNDIIRMWITNDNSNLYVRWDVVLSKNETSIASATYDIAIASSDASAANGTKEAIAYVSFDSKGVISMATANSTYTNTFTSPNNYVEVQSLGNNTYAVEAKIPFAAFNGTSSAEGFVNNLVSTPIGPGSVVPLWGQSLQSGSFTSNAPDIVPDQGYFDYDVTTKTGTPVGTGPIPDVRVTALNTSYPGGVVNYEVTVKNVGDNTGGVNLDLSGLTLTLPSGFTYHSGSATGLTTSDPSGTSSLAWSGLSSSLAPGQTATLNFQADVASSVTPNDTSAVQTNYDSDLSATFTSPSETIETGGIAPVIIGSAVAPSVPAGLTHKNVTSSGWTESWTAVSNATSYDLYVGSTKLNPSPIIGTTYDVSGESAGQTYSVTVVATNSIGSSAKSSADSVTTLSNNADLSNLGLSQGTLSPAFAASKIAYTADVANGVSNITVTPTVADSAATVTVNGTTVASGSASSSIPLKVGSNTITVVVTAQDGTKKTYTVDVTRAAAALSSNNDLSDLRVSKGTLSPTFAAGTTSYTDIVANSVTNVTVTPTVADSAATVTVNGTTVASGSASSSIPLNVGSNTITVVVTAQDGTKKTYTVDVTRAAAALSSNNDLSDLRVSKGTLSPNFAAGTTSYTDIVANSVTNVTVTPTVADSAATVTVNGTTVASGSASSSIPLNVGSNTITVVVTAQDGTKKTYTVDVTRAKSSDDKLTNLAVSQGTLTPTFATGTTSYTDNVANSVSSITVTPTVEDSAATVTVNGTSVASGSASGAIALNVGSNTITVVVTAQDGTKKTYTVDVTRAAAGLSSNNDLSDLTVSQGTLNPTFTAATASYTNNVANSVSSITVTPTVADNTATVTVNGKTVASGSASTAIPLTVGSNAITVVVTAEDGTTQTYTVDVTRAAVPIVSGISPASGPDTGGRSITITGTGFTGATGVAFGSTPAKSFTVISDIQITATAPAGSGTQDVTVTGAGGTSSASAGDKFTYQTVTQQVYAPTVSGISPASGPESGGRSITITGTGFTGATGVAFGPNPAKSFTVNSDISITATAPAGSGTQDVTVTGVGGTSSASAGDKFTYIHPHVWTVPTTPTSISHAGVSQTGWTETWSPASGATGYNVYVNGKLVTTYPIRGTSYTISGATPATTYAVEVTAVSPAGSSSLKSDTVTTSPEVPSAPSGLSHSDVTQSGWTESWASVNGATGYNVYINGGKVSSTGGTSYTVSGLQPGTTYSLTLTAVNKGGESAPSAPDVVKTLAITSPTVIKAGKPNESYSQLLTQVGATPPNTWKILDGKLPKGLQLHPTTGEITGNTKSSKPVILTVQITDSTGAKRHKQVVVDAVPNNQLEMVWHSANLQAANVPTLTKKQTQSHTTYVSIWYVMHMLKSFGIHSTWNGISWNIQSSATVSQSSHSGSGKMVINVNGKTVNRENGIISTDPNSHQATTFMTISSVQQLMKLLGLAETWNGTAWVLAPQPDDSVFH